MVARHLQPDMVAGTRRKPRLVFLAAVAVALLLVVWGLLSRHWAATDLRAATEQQAIPTVLVAEVKDGPKTEDVVLPGNVQANFEAPIYARTNGYVKRWFTDIGTPVKEGQILAELDTPDVDDQLHQAEADLMTAQANSQLAQSTARRWQGLLKTNSVSAQETDEKVSDAAAKQAATAASNANVSRLRQLQSFKRVTAPFDGVVTARLTDVGALITAGTNTILFRVADTSKLRIYVQVPQTYASVATPGMKVGLEFAEHPGHKFDAKLVRTAEALDPASRTLLVELQLDNTERVLLPGGYTQVHLTLPAPSTTIRLPASALLFRAEGLRVATVQGGADSHIALKQITLGRDFGSEIEITAGIAPGDKIVVNPPDSLTDGEVVHVATPAAGTGS